MTWIALVAWLLIVSVFLSDGPVLVATVGDRLSAGTRQLCLGLPLLFGPFALLLTPWATWVALLVAAVVLLHLMGHALWVRSLALAPAPAEVASEVVRLCAAWEVRPPDRICVGPAGPAVIGLRRQVLVLPAPALGAPEGALACMPAPRLGPRPRWLPPRPRPLQAPGSPRWPG